MGPTSHRLMHDSASARSWFAALRAALYHDPAPVGGVAVALLAGTYGLFALPLAPPLLILGFCGTALAYAVDRVWTERPEDRVNRPNRVAWVEAHSGWLALETSIFVAGAVATVPFLRADTLFWIVALGGIAGLHVLPRGGVPQVLIGLRKPVVIAGAWAGGALLPVVEAGQPVGLGVLLFFAYRFLFILPNLLLADWGDRVGDAEAGLRPWAMLWSGKQVRWVATGLLLLAMAGGGLWVILGPSPFLVALDAAGLVLMLGVVWRFDHSRPRDAFLADLVVGWPLIPAFVAWMIV